MKKLTLALLGLVATGQVFAHGYQTYPLSRTEYQRLKGVAPIVWEPQSVASNLTGAGGSSYEEILNTNGGPLAFFKKYHVAQNRNICSQASDRWKSLDTVTPDADMAVVNYGQDLQFKWTYTAWHQTSNMFVFITNYKGTQYNANPNWSDLTLLCSVPISTKSNTGSWTCKLPTTQMGEKQVIVTVWQRQDAAGENFVSCADVKFKGGTPINPEEIWSPIEKNPKPWISSIGQPKANQLVTFELNQTKGGVTTNVATYNLSVTAKNLATWDQILADKINNDTTFTQVIAVGELNAKEGSVTYNSADQSKDFVYVNNTVADPTVKYSYKISKKKDPNPVVTTWSPVGYELKQWLDHGQIKKGDQLTFSLNVAGKEETLEPVTVNKVDNAEKLIVNAINKHTFANGLKVKAGVLNGKQVKFEAGGDNRVYVYKDSDDTTVYSYVIRNGATPVTKYKVYPDGMGTYTSGEIVMDSASGQLYSCVYPSWCNTRAYPLNSGAWSVYNPVPAPLGYETYSPEAAAQGTYKAGSVVAGRTDGQLYECKGHPYTAWCNGSPAYYEPGKGSNWADAWIKK